MCAKTSARPAVISARRPPTTRAELDLQFRRAFEAAEESSWIPPSSKARSASVVTSLACGRISATSALPSSVRCKRIRRPSFGSSRDSTSPRRRSREMTPRIVAGSMAVSRPSTFCETSSSVGKFNECCELRWCNVEFAHDPLKDFSRALRCLAKQVPHVVFKLEIVQRFRKHMLPRFHVLRLLLCPMTNVY